MWRARRGRTLSPDGSRHVPPNKVGATPKSRDLRRRRTALSNVLTIAAKELRVFFVSPLFYVVTAIFVGLTALFFALDVLSTNQALMSASFSSTLFVMLLAAPVLTMRLIAQEKQQGTMELLLTSPVRDVEVVLGKFLASLGMYATMLAFTLIDVVILLITAVDKHKVLFWQLGNPDWGPIMAGYTGHILLVAGFLAIGIFASSVTQNQIIAALISVAAILFLFVCGFASSYFNPPVSDFLTFLNVNAHSDRFNTGVLSVTDLAYALTLIFAPLYLAVVVLGARRWH